MDMDEDQFTDLYRRTSRPLWSYAARVSGSSTVADEVLQESFYRYLSAELPAMNDVQRRSYLFRIATNLLRDRWRSREDIAQQPAEQAALAQDLESEIDLRNALGQLHPRQRQLLWLAYVEGASHAEIAQVTGLHAASIRTLLLRARRRLATLLQPWKRTVNTSEER